MDTLQVVPMVAALLSLPDLPLDAAAPMRPGAGNNAKPNIVLIVADELGYNDLGCYGASLVKTPRIDALARQTDAWEGGHRVPCIARWPNQIPAGTVRREFFVQVDLMATLAEAAGIPTPQGASPDGSSELAAFLHNRNELARCARGSLNSPARPLADEQKDAHKSKSQTKEPNPGRSRHD